MEELGITGVRGFGVLGGFGVKGLRVWAFARSNASNRSIASNSSASGSLLAQECAQGFL